MLESERSIGRSTNHSRHLSPPGASPIDLRSITVYSRIGYSASSTRPSRLGILEWSPSRFGCFIAFNMYIHPVRLGCSWHSLPTNFEFGADTRRRCVLVLHRYFAIQFIISFKDLISKESTRFDPRPGTGRYYDRRIHDFETKKRVWLSSRPRKALRSASSIPIGRDEFRPCARK